MGVGNAIVELMKKKEEKEQLTKGNPPAYIQALINKTFNKANIKLNL